MSAVCVPLNHHSVSYVDEVRAYLSTPAARVLFKIVFYRYRESHLSEDDLIQDMAVRCLEQAHHFHGGNVEAWARVVAQRVVLNELRSPRRKYDHIEYRDQVASSNDFDRSKNPYARPDHLSEARDLARALWEGASDREREMLCSMLVHQGSGTSVARELGRNKHTVNTACRKQKLRFMALQKG